MDRGLPGARCRQAARLYGQSGNELTHFTPDYPTLHYYDWDPVWYIRNC